MSLQQKLSKNDEQLLQLEQAILDFGIFMKRIERVEDQIRKLEESQANVFNSTLKTIQSLFTLRLDARKSVEKEILQDSFLQPSILESELGRNDLLDKINTSLSKDKQA